LLWERELLQAALPRKSEFAKLNQIRVGRNGRQNVQNIVGETIHGMARLQSEVEHCLSRIKQQECVGRKVSVSNERESNESAMKRDAIMKKADAPKKSVVIAKERVPKNENMKESVPLKKGSKGSKGGGQKE
jgi:hypothetical protein